MEWLAAPDYWLGRLVVQRLLGLVYLLAFIGVRNQFRALLGEHGLSPVPRYVRRVPFRHAPSLFQWRYSDRLLGVVAWAGIVLSGAVVLGLPEAGPVWLSMLVWALLWAGYLSVVNVGQIFYAFGWESLLVEAGFLAIFLGPADLAPPVAVLWLLRWLLFRVELGAGLIKLRGDPCWRDLTCLYYHNETQPLPNPLSWRFHHAPRLVHRIEVGANHVAQLVVPFGLFAPQPVAGVAAGIIVVTQAWLLVSGNFAWLNLVTITLAFAALPDTALQTVLPVDPPASVTAPPVWLGVVVLAVTGLVVALSWRPARNLVSREQRMNASFDPLRLVNTYGAFGSITRRRDEIVVEGTTDPDPSVDATWRAYGFRAKPGETSRRSPQVAPYHLRLDWLMWFAAMSTPRSHPWFLALVERLLEADPATLGLLRHDPFDGARPTAVRARRYRYRFTTPGERRATGQWWVRTLEGDYLPPVRLGADDRLVALQDRS